MTMDRSALQAATTATRSSTTMVPAPTPELRLEFGFAPPPGDREMGPIRRATYVRDLDTQLRFVVQHFSSVWTSDHVMEHANYRHECCLFEIDDVELFVDRVLPHFR